MPRAVLKCPGVPAELSSSPSSPSLAQVQRFNVEGERHIWVPRADLHITYGYKWAARGFVYWYNTPRTNPVPNGNVVHGSWLFVCPPAPSLSLTLFIYAHMQKI